MLRLYGYFRSSASFRVRIALNLKQLSWDHVPVHLVRDGGEQLAPEFRALNPDCLVPVLLDGDQALHQSLAIIEYLEETRPEPALLPRDPRDRAWVRGLALAIACEIHPLNNLRVLKYLKGPLGVSDEVRDNWYRHWVETGFAALEKRLAGDARTGDYCFGGTPTLADICLVPQVFNAQRFNVDLQPYPAIRRIHENCLKLEAFASAVPARQPDTEA